MQIERPKLHPMAELAIRKLQESGVVVAPEDAVWLQHLAERTQNPAGHAGPLDWIDMPVRVGTTDLWPLSIGAEMWLYECAYNWFSKDSTRIVLAEAFAMAFSRDMGTIRKACDAKTTAKMLRAFALDLDVSFEALEENVSRILGRIPTVDLADSAQAAPAENVAVKWGDVVAVLCHNCGGTPEDWIWNRSAAQVLQVFDKALLLQNHGMDQPAVSDDKAHAIHRFKLAVESLKVPHG